MRSELLAYAGMLCLGGLAAGLGSRAGAQARATSQLRSSTSPAAQSAYELLVAPTDDHQLAGGPHAVCDSVHSLLDGAHALSTAYKQGLSSVSLAQQLISSCNWALLAEHNTLAGRPATVCDIVHGLLNGAHALASAEM